MRPSGPNSQPETSQAKNRRIEQPAKRQRSTVALTGGLCLAIVPALAEQGWQNSGEFTLTDQSKSEGWILPITAWRSTHAFEKSEPGFGATDHEFVLDLSGYDQLAQLFSLIASVEAPIGQYDAVHHKARVMPPAPPTQLRLSQIFEWIEATPGQFHAIGRYQFIPDTLAWLVEREGIDGNARFSRSLQDRLANCLIDDAGYAAFLEGRMPANDFMDSLARIWAGLPMRNGRSAYHGLAGNRAQITRAAYEEAFFKIFPHSAARRIRPLMTHKMTTWASDGPLRRSVAVSGIRPRSR